MEIISNKEARDLLIEVITELNDVVSKTMGPNGSTVIIPSNKEHGKYIITKDGVSVAKAVKF
jgi:chaperonin GroEL (HSP60 family)